MIDSSPYNVLIGNVIEYNDVGVDIDESSFTSFMDNKIMHCNVNCLQLISSLNNTINGNTIINNALAKNTGGYGIILID